MSREIRVSPDGTGLRLGVVVASWNQAINERMLAGARRRAEEAGVKELTVIWVPGALEIPLGAKALIEHGCHAVVAIGTVIKGETDHYDIVVRESSSGIARVALDSGVPVANAILAVRDPAQAMVRSEPGTANRGAEAVDAALATASAIARLSGDVG